MGLGLNIQNGEGGSSGGFNAIIKYNAKAGRMFRIDRIEEGGVYSNEEVEITQGFTAVMDLANLEVGYAKMMKGQAPDFRMVKLGEGMPQRPEGQSADGKPAYKQAFRMMLKLGKTSGGDVREFASSANCVLAVVDAIHTAYEKAPEAAKGMLPVVAMPKTEKKPGKQDDNYAPVFQITKWVARPADLGAGGTAAEEDDGFPTQVAAPAKKLVTSKAVAPPAPVEDEDDFG